MEEQLSSIDIVKHKVQFGGGLEGVMESDQERVLHVAHEHVTLCHDVLHFIPLDDSLLLEDFDGKALPTVLMPTQIHLQWVWVGHNGWGTVGASGELQVHGLPSQSFLYR